MVSRGALSAPRNVYPSIVAVQIPVRAVCFLGALSVAAAAFAQDAAQDASQAEIERTRALVEAGALPRAALARAESEAERRKLEQRLRELSAKRDLTPNEVPELIQAAARLVDISRAELRRVQALVDAGAVPPRELEPLKMRADAAVNMRDLVETRARLVKQLAAMVDAEERLEELEEEDLAFSSDGTGGVWWDDLDVIQSLYYEEFGTPLPISADGDTPLHRSMGYDHAGRVDVALHPDDLEGFFLIEVLESWGIPYIAFRSAVPGQATGPHIHIGLPSPRIPEEPLD